MPESKPPAAQHLSQTHMQYVCLYSHLPKVKTLWFFPCSPKLALTSEFPPSYVGITSNITATSANNDTCIEAPSTRLNATANITILTPGPGFCRTDGSMPPGNYTLTQDPPPGVVLDRVECYDISNGTELLVPTNGSVDLSGNKTISCKMVYVFAAR